MRRMARVKQRRGAEIREQMDGMGEPMAAREKTRQMFVHASRNHVIFAGR